MMRGAGITHGALMADRGAGFVVRHCTVDYRLPALLDDEIEVRTTIGTVAGAHIEAEQRVMRQGALLVTIGLRLGCVGRNGRAGRFPAWCRRIGVSGETMKSDVFRAVEIGASAVAKDFSLWGLFMQADAIVKAVIVLLLLASLWSWAIIFDKAIRYACARRLAVEFEQAFWSGGSLEQLYDDLAGQRSHPMTVLFASAMDEWRRFTDRGTRLSADRLEGLQRRIAYAMDAALNRELDQLERYLGFLATVGATAPFVGLFGTVWGIMNSFQSIAVSKDTSLAVVAPGIAEALFATALGLVAAIPAVVAYNKLSSDLDRYAGRLEAFGTEFRALLGRQLEERAG